MKLFVWLLLFMMNISGGFYCFATGNKPSVAGTPAWVSMNKIDYNNTKLDKEATDGYVDISYEKQILLAEQSCYYKESKRILSQAGVQNASTISIDYNPAYEKLILHTIVIIRDGKILNQLHLEQIEVLQQEKELSSFIYNGSMNAVLILKDVRKGDIIEYSYTTKGFNPIFNNKFSSVLQLGFSVPLYQYYCRMIVANGRKINIKNANYNQQPTITQQPNNQVYEWQKKDIGPITTQDYLPSWYNPFPRVYLSEFNSWKEVNDWALPLFPKGVTLSSDLQKKIKEISDSNQTDANRIKASLRFVQDDIRYMGIEMGVNSHKPANPSKVYAQRFGDCKEKSYLLCCMLWAMKIDANVVLINTDKTHELENTMPSPLSFDHATVRVKLGNEYLWFDPTIAYQRGAVNNIFFPNYEKGLVLDVTTTSLTTIPFKDLSYAKVIELYQVASLSGSGTLKVITTYMGNVADAQRYDFNNESIADLMSNSQKFYANSYEGIKADSLTFTDDENTGIFTTFEYYTIPHFWKNDKPTIKKFSFGPDVINGIFVRPKDRERTMPFRLSFPARYQEEIVVTLPEPWQVTESETHISGNFHCYNSHFYCTGNQVHLDVSYQTTHSYIDSSEAERYFTDLAEFDKSSNYQISKGDTGDVKKENGNINLIIFVITLLLVIGIIIFIRRQS